MLDWLRKFLEYISDNFRNAELTIMGDFNFNYLNKNCAHVKSLKMLEQLFDIKQVIASPTRSTKNCSTLIDLCFTNMSNIQRSGVIEYNLSDHCPIFVQKKKQKLESKKSTFIGRNYKKYTVEALYLELDKIDWNRILQMKNPNDQWDAFFGYIISVVDKLCPLKTYNVTKTRPVYISDEILDRIKERDMFLRLAKKHNNQAYWEKGMSLVKEVIKTCKEAKCIYVRDKSKEHAKDSKKFWKSVKLVLPDNKSTSITVIWDEEKNELVSGMDAANLINNYFSNVGFKLASIIKPVDMDFHLPQSDIDLN